MRSFGTKWLVVDEDLTVVVAGTGTGSGAAIETFEGGVICGGRADGDLMVLHIGGCDVISQGGLGRLVVVVVVAETKENLDFFVENWKTLCT